MEKNYRSGRLGEEIRKTVGMMLLTELKDHRLQGRMISVSDVEVSSDGSYATVYLSVMGRNIESGAQEEEKKEIPAMRRRSNAAGRLAAGAQVLSR